MATINFDANEVEPLSGFDPIPAGKYQAIITESEAKATKNGSGTYLQFTFEIIEGEYKGRKIWERLNLANPNAQAVAISRGRLSAICRAVGVMTPRDSIELHNLPLTISVRLRKNQSDEFVNEISGYESRQHAAAACAGSNGENAAQPPPPWARK